MGASNGDLIQVIDYQTYLGQQMLNVYYWRVTALAGLADGYLEEFGVWFNNNILPKVCQVQVPGVQHLNRDWRNLSNGVDLYVDGEVVPGQNPAPEANWLPSFVSLGFLLQRESLATRNGYKRIGGLDETDIEGNTWVGNPVWITDLEDVLAQDLMAGIAVVAEPIIVHRPITPPVGAYTYSSIGSARFRGIGTQNTRKQGRGI